MAALPLILAVGSSLLSAQQEVSAGKTEAAQAELEASQEELAVTQRETDRKSRLAKAIASQNAANAAGGIASFEGSPLTVLGESFEAEKLATSRDVFNTKLRAATLRAGGASAKATSQAGAGISLLSGATQVFSSDLGKK